MQAGELGGPLPFQADVPAPEPDLLRGRRQWWWWSYSQTPFFNITARADWCPECGHAEVDGSTARVVKSAPTRERPRRLT